MSDAIELFYAPTSPYVRKVMACAIELGIADRIVRLPSAAHPLKRDERISTFNPLAKVPAAKLANGTLLFDSRVICEYLDDLGHGSLFPRGPQRWQVLTEQALGDGLLDAALLTRYENTCRSDEHRSGFACWTIRRRAASGRAEHAELQPAQRDRRTAETGSA